MIRYTEEDVRTICNMAESNFSRIIQMLTGITAKPESNGDIRCSCPIHNGDGNSFAWSGYKARWACFSQCGTGGVIKFVQMVCRLEYWPAVEKIAEIVGFRTDNIIEFTPKPHVNQPKQQQPIHLLKESLLRKMEGTHPGWNRVDDWVREYIGGGYCAIPTNKMYGRLTIPVRDEDGRLVGITARCATSEPPVDAEDWIQMRWSPRPERFKDESKNLSCKYTHFGANKIDEKTGEPYGSFKTGQVLLNIHNARNYGNLPLLLVEGPFDMAKAIEHGYKAVVAVQGSFVSKEQWDMIQRYFKKIIYAMDPDTFLPNKEHPGSSSKFDRFLKQANERNIPVNTLRLPKGIDIGDSSKELFTRSIYGALTGT